MIWELTTTRTLEGEKKEKDPLEKEIFIGVHSIFNAVFTRIRIFWREKAHSPHQFLKGVYDPSLLYPVV